MAAHPRVRSVQRSGDVCLLIYGALLANVIVFELFKTVTGAAESELRNSLYLLDLETLEGSWHPLLPHPLAAGKVDAAANWVDDAELRLEEEPERRRSERAVSVLQQVDFGPNGNFP